MRIVDVRAFPILMTSSWLNESLIANPMSIYPRYRERRSSWYGPMTSAIVEITRMRGFEVWAWLAVEGQACAVIIEEQLKNLLIGQNPFNIELLWEQMFRASQFYGRKGAVIEVISGIDLALWDMVGKALGQPVYKLVGGKTKEKIPVYVTGNLTERHLQEGFRHVKLALPHGPADGAEGFRKNLDTGGANAPIGGSGWRHHAGLLHGA